MGFSIGLGPNEGSGNQLMRSHGSCDHNNRHFGCLFFGKCRLCWKNMLTAPLKYSCFNLFLVLPEMCSERDSPLKRLYRRTHAKLTRLAGSGQLVWAPGCEFSLALVHARRPAWPGETSETILRVAPPRKTRPPDHTRVNWPVDASASGSAQVGPGGRHRWAARVQVGREPARQKAREGYPSHYTSLVLLAK